MRTVKVKVLKNKLNEYVRLAERGETILVTDRDRVIARIVPPETSHSSMLSNALLIEAVRQGRITPAALPASGSPPRKPVLSMRELTGALADDRRDR